MLLLGISLSFLICSSAPPLAQPLAQSQQIVSFDDYKVEFFKAFYSTVDTLMIVGLHADFKQQITEGCRNQVNLDRLLQQLPFEPDNLRTGDCTFQACANVLMLDEYYRTHSPELLEILGHVAVLTYFRHSVAFFSDVFTLALEDCARKIGARFPIAANYYKEFSNSESSNFEEYKKIVLEKMAAYVTKQKIPVPSGPSGLAPWLLKITVASDSNERHAGKLEVTKTGTVKIVSSSDEDDGALKVVYKKVRSRVKGSGEELEDFTGDGGIRFLVSEVAKKLGRIVKITRQFSDNLGAGGVELGKTFIYPPHATYPVVDVQYTLSASAPVSVSTQSFASTVQQYPDLHMPTLVLQVPTTYIDNPVDEYLTDPEKVAHAVQVHRNLVVQEKATRHAIVASFAVASNQNTWFSGKRGLGLTAQIQKEIRNWIVLTQTNFEMHYQLSRKN